MIQVAIVGRQQFFTLGLRRCIAEWPEFSVVWPPPDQQALAEQLGAAEENVDLFVVVEQEHASLLAVCELITSHFSEAKLCVLSDSIPAHLILQCGADSHLPTNCAPTILRGTLHMLVVGANESRRVKSTSDAQINGAPMTQLHSQLNGSMPVNDLLSERELQVLRLAAKGRRNEQIAGELHISTATVKAHMRNIMRKLEALDRTHAAVEAYRRGWL